MGSKHTYLIMAVGAFLLVFALYQSLPTFALLTDEPELQVAPIEPEAVKFLSAAIAFSMASIGAGWAVSKAGSAGLAAAAERPEVRTTAIIISALGEALGIYGIVIAIMILGA